MQKYFSLVLFALSLGVVPGVVHAQAPEPLDPRCFTQTECSAARAKMGLTVTGDTVAGVKTETQVQGFYTNTSETHQACKGKTDGAGVELGFCLPAGQAVTSVKFGGTTRFANIGVFIQYIYRYGIIFAGILAVIIIIVSGLQWTASGGNSSTIESAKNRITGALTGLILAAASYIILNTINPSTVNLRLPQVWLLRSDRIQNEYPFCIGIPAVPGQEAGTFKVPKIANYSENYQAIPDGSFAPAYEIVGASSLDRYQQVFPPKQELPAGNCGQKIVVQDTQGTSCVSTYCPQGQFCFPEEKKCLPFQSDGGIAGKISINDGKYLDDIWLRVVCSDGQTDTIEDIDHQEPGDGATFYYFPDVTTKGNDACDGAEHVLGYFMIIEVNDSDLLNTTDDQWMGGKSFCSINGPSCGFYGFNGSLNDSDALPFLGAMEQTGELFLPNEVKTGVNCSFNQTLDSMPNIGNAYSTYLFYAGVKTVAGLFGNDVGQAAGSAVAPGNEVSAEFGTLNGKCQELNNKQKQWDAYIEEKKKAKK